MKIRETLELKSRQILELNQRIKESLQSIVVSTLLPLRDQDADPNNQLMSVSEQKLHLLIIPFWHNSYSQSWQWLWGLWTLMHWWWCVLVWVQVGICSNYPQGLWSEGRLRRELTFPGIPDVQWERDTNLQTDLCCGQTSICSVDTSIIHVLVRLHVMVSPIETSICCAHSWGLVGILFSGQLLSGVLHKKVVLRGWWWEQQLGFYSVWLKLL